MESIRSTIVTILRVQVDEWASVREGLTSATGFLSPFLESAFDLYAVEAAGSKFVVASSVNSISGQQLESRLPALQKALDMPTVLFAPHLTAAMRRSFISNRQGFITAAGDVYLPHLAMSLTPAKYEAVALPGPFTPSEQSVFLYCLYGNESDIAQDAIQDRLGLSSASVSRALSTLCNRGLLDYEVGGLTGRRKSYSVPDKGAYYRKGLQFFGSPVAKRYLASLGAYDEQPMYSGLTALSAMSNLTRPSRDVVAVGFSESKRIIESEKHAIGFDKNVEVQVLRYDPRPLGTMVRPEKKYVDPVTMMLTVGEADERVSMAIREVMEEYEWCTG